MVVRSANRNTYGELYAYRCQRQCLDLLLIRCYDEGVVRPESCTDLAGESPIRVSAGAPGSRPQLRGVIPWVRAGRQKPSVRREQRSGPQHKVNAAASTDLQWESRAAHFTAKATDDILQPDGVSYLSGVWAVARFKRFVRNRRDPTRPPTYGKDPRYKAMLKSEGVGRESEGFIVLLKAVKINRRREGTLLRSRLDERKRGGLVNDPYTPPDQTREKLGSPPMGVCQATLVAHAASGRPSVSRVLENCKHGLNGGLRKPEVIRPTGA